MAIPRSNFDDSSFVPDKSSGFDHSAFVPDKSSNREMTDEENGKAIIQRILSNKPVEQPDDREAYLKLFPNAITGLAQAGHGLLNAPHNIANAMNSDWGKKIPKLQPKEYDYAKMLGLSDNATTADKAIRFLFQQSPALLAPELGLGKAGEAIKSIPYAGRLLKSMIGKATPIAAYEATQSENPIKSAGIAAGATVPFSVLSHLITSTNPWISMGARGASALAGGAAGYEGAQALGADTWNSKAVGALIGALTGGIGGNTANQARDKMLTGVNPEVALPKIEAAKRLGLSYVTPGEVGGNPFTAGQQGTVGKTDTGGQLLYSKGKERLKSESDAINKLRNTIYDPEKDDFIKQILYKKAYTKDADADFIKDMKRSPIIKAAFKKVQKDPAYQEELNLNPKTMNMLPIQNYSKGNSFGVARDRHDMVDMKDDGNGNARIMLSNVREPNKGSGKELYKAAIQEAKNKGLNIESDASVSDSAMNVYKSLEKEGYKFKYNPDVKRFKGEDGQQVTESKNSIDPVIELIHAPDFKLPVAQNNYAYLDQVNRALNDMHTSALTKAGEGNKARIIKNKQKEMLETLDTNNPDFKRARGLAEREITRRDEVEKALKMRNMTGTNFFRKLLQNEDKFKDLQHSLRNVPEAQAQLKDMEMVFGDLINPPTQRTQAGHTRNNMNQPRNTQDSFMSKLKELFSGNQLDKMSVEMMTNPKWHEQLKDIGKISDFRTKSAKASELLGKVAASLGGDSESKKPMVLELNKFKGYQQ